jgi:glycosyltransferase involved in cell wall biosynthesis
MTAKTVSVIIPVRSDPRVFAAVDSVLACGSEAGSLQVIIIDNASTPGFSAELTERLGATCTLLHEDEPGVYAARNRGVDAATGAVILFTDADCLVRAGWITQALKALEGDDIVQGYSGSIGDSRVQLLIQRRYEAHLRNLAPGRPTECDTRNLGMRREVFETLRFEERYRRVGDTEFGLRAEAAGFTVAYEPAMYVDHEHEADLPLFAAKQVCHGWGAQRLMQEHPEVEWHGGHLKTVAKVSRRLEPRRATGVLAKLCSRGAILNARLLQKGAPRLPIVVGFWWLTAIDKVAALGGHLSYRRGASEPSPSELLGRTLLRD